MGLANYKPHPMLEILHDIIDGQFAVIWLTREELEGERTQPPERPENYQEWAQDDEGTSPWTVKPTEDATIWISPYDDPNAGLKPSDESVEGGYTNYDSGWDGGQKAHFGGTSLHAQSCPDITPYYLELEDFDYLNFGGGVAQYDLETSFFDWAQ